MSVRCVLSVVIPLVLVYGLFPDFCGKIVYDLIGFTLSSRIHHSEGQNSENEINWLTLYVVLGITFVITVVLCTLLKSSNCGLFLFYTWIVTCLIVEVTLSIYISYNYENVKRDTVHWLQKSFDDYSNPGSEIKRILLNDLQTLLKCCGFYGPGSWERHRVYLLKTYNSPLPDSCCEKNVMDHCNIDLPAYETIGVVYTDNCFKNIDKYLEENAKLVIWTLKGLAVVKIAAVLVSNYYSAQLKRVFQISSTKLSNKVNKTGSTKKRYQCSDDTLLEKI